jgi:hypothetical protein
VSKLAVKNYIKPTPSGALVVESNEMRHLSNQKTNAEYGRLIVAMREH